MPMRIGLIGGSGLLKTTLPALQSMTEEFVDTLYGRVFLRTSKLSDDVELVFVQRHDAKPSRVYTQPFDINYQGIALALAAKKVDVVVAICSVGSLKPSIGVGSLVVCDDFYCPSDLRRIYTDMRAHLMPGFNEPLRQTILEAVRGVGLHPLTHGTYVNSHGPRFETKAEIRMMSSVGEVVGMTGAHECSACAEVGLPYAMLCMVDNFANGIGSELTLEAFHAAQAVNRSTVEKCVQAILDCLPAKAGLWKSVKGSSADKETHTSSSTGAGATASSVPIEVDTLIHARFVVPVAAGRESQVLDYHSIAIRDSVIVDILPTSESVKYSAKSVVHVDTDHAVMPGLINAHTHMSMNFLRGVADDMPLAQWLSEQIWPTEARLVSPDFCRAGSLAAAAELIRSGVTCVNEMYWFPEATAEIVDASGMRGTIGTTIFEFPSSYGANAADYIDKGLDMMKRWKAKYPEAHRRVRFALAPHAPYTVSDATFERIRDLAEEHDVKVHLHLHETAGEVESSKAGTAGSTKHLSEHKLTPVENLDRMKMLNQRMIAIHMTQLTDAEIKRLAETKTSVVHCPNSNLKLASGFCPVSKLVAAGVNVALGTDSASSNNSLDFFQEMKLAAVLAKGVSLDATAVPAWQALRMATLNGAIALGIDDHVGSIEVGKRADLIAVDLGGLDQLPVYNVVSHLVYACSRSCVTDVWVDGKPLMTDRRLTTLDEASVRATILKWAEEVRPGMTAVDKHETLKSDTKH